MSQNFMSKFYILLIALLAFSQTHAANRFWIAATPSNWNNTANWSTTSGGVGGASVPTAADVAIFDVNGLGDCNNDMNINVLGIQINGYLASLNQNAFTVTLGSSGFNQNSGIFVGSASTITNIGVLTLTGGTFTSTSGTLFQKNNMSITSGSFLHNNGRVTVSTNSTTNVISGVFTFYDLEISGDNLVTNFSGTTQTVTHDFYFTNTSYAILSNGGLNLSGNLYDTNTRNSDHGHTNFTINFVGATDQTIFGASSRLVGNLPGININKPSGNLVLKDFITIELDFIQTSGNIDYSTFPNRVILKNNKTITGNFDLSEVEFTGFSTTFTLSPASNLNVHSTLYLSGNSVLRFNGTGNIHAKADIDCSVMTYTGGNAHGSANIVIDGTLDQNFIGGAIYTMRLPNIEINKPSGTLFLQNFINVEKNWTYTTGAINYLLFSNKVSFLGNLTITGSHDLGEVEFMGSSTIFDISSGTILTVNGTLYFTGNNVLRINTGKIKAMQDIDCSTMSYTGYNNHVNGTISLEGLGNQNFIGGAIFTMNLPNIEINKSSGTLFLKNFITSEKNWIYLGGNIDYSSFPNRVVFSGSKIISGSHGLGEIQFHGASTIYDITVGTTITANNTLFFTGNNVLRINTGIIRALKDIDCSAMIYSNGNGHSNGTLLIDGTTDQNFIGGAIYTMRLPNVIINKASGTLFLKNFINSERDWTYSTGTVDYTSFPNRVVFMGTKTITGSLNLNEVEFVGSSSVYTIASGTTITANSTLFFTGNNLLRINTGTVQALQDIDCSTMVYPNANGHNTTGTLLINGTTDQNFIGGAIYTMRLPSVVINKTSGTLFLKNFINSENNWTYTAGTVDYTSFPNRVVFVGTKTITGSLNLGEVQFTGISSLYTISAGTVITANSTLYFVGNSVLRILAGTIEAKADISCVGMTYNNVNSHTGTLLINGTGNQNIIGNTSRYQCRLPNVIINKPSGDLILKDFVTAERNWTYLSGNIDYTSFYNRVIFVGIKTITGTHDLGEVEIYGNGTYTIPASDVITANNTLFVTGAGPFPIVGGKFAAKSDIDLTQNTETPTNGHTGAFLINGTGTQHFFGNARLTCKTPTIMINKPSGTLILHDNINVEGNWNYTSGTMDWSSNTNRVIFIGNKTISGTHDLGETEFFSSNNTFNVSAASVITSNLNCYINGPGTFQFTGGGKFGLKSDLIVQSDILISAAHNMNFEFNGTGDQNFEGITTIYNSTLPTIIINKPSGNLFLKNNITVQGNWIYTQGNVDYFTNPNQIIFRDTKTISGSHTLGNVEIYGSGIYTIPAGTTLQVDSLLQFTSTGQFRLTSTGVIEAIRDVMVSNTYTGLQNHTATLRFIGTENQNFDGSKVFNQARLPHIEIVKTGGILSLIDTLNVEGNWTYVSGNVDPGLYEVAFYTAKALDCEGPSSTMNFYNMSLNDATVRNMNGDVTVTNNLMLKNGILRLNKNRMTVTQNTLTSISRTSGYIISEETDNEGKVTWNVGSTTGAYIYPFGRVTGEFIPFTFNLTAGDAGNVTISTYPTGNPNLPFPTTPDPVLYLNNNHGHNNSANVVNRFWQIDKDGVSGTATMTFVYANGEWDVTEPSDYQAQRYNKLTNKWEDGLAGQTRSVAANSVTVPNVTTFSPWTLATVTEPLPLTLVSFQAKALTNEVELHWLTKNESNMSYQVEKSINLVDFQTIDSQTGKGQRDNEYFSIDVHPISGKNYYRLKMIDLDGTISYSQIEEITFLDNQISIFPNPATDQFTINLGNNESAQVEIYDALGKIMYQNLTTEPSLSIQTNTWSKGIYYVKINGQTVKLMLN